MFRNIDLKRRIARLCLFLTIFAFLVNSLIAGVVEVEADSNDRRQTYISLAKGKSATEIEEIEGMNNDELQCVALYLTNFYKLWNTRLDKIAFGSSDIESSEESEAVLDMMTSALSNYCGFDKDTAKFLVAKCLSYNVQTRKEFLIKDTDLKVAYAYYAAWSNAYTNDGSICGTLDIDDPDYHHSNKVDRPFHNGIGTLGKAYVSNEGVNKNSDDHGLSWVWINDYARYVERLGGYKYDASGTKYVQVTYPIFLSVMNLSSMIASWDILTEKANDDSDEGANIRSFINTHINTYYFRRLDLEEVSISQYDNGSSLPKYNIANLYQADGSVKGGISPNLSINGLTKVINFYYLDDTGVAHTVFSNSNECMKMYSLLCDSLDYSNGYGSAFLAAPYSEINGYLKDDDYTAFSSLTAFEQKLYVNWVGDILVDTKMHLYPIFAGCANPYMLTVIDERLTYGLTTQEFDTAVKANQTCLGKEGSNATKENVTLGNRLNLLNVYALENSRKLASYEVDFGEFLTEVEGVPSVADRVSKLNDLELGKENVYVVYHKNYYDSYTKSDGSLYQLYYWRQNMGKNESDWDGSNDSSFGKYEPVWDYFSSSNCPYSDTTSQFGADFIGFPSWVNLLSCPTTQSFQEHLKISSKKGLDRIGSTSAFYTQSAENSFGQGTGHCWWYGYETVTGTWKISQYLHGDSLANSTMLAYDNLRGYSEGQTLDSFFQKGDIITTHSKLNLSGGTYQGINDTKLSYSLETKQFFQPLFLTYCFALFNKDAKSFNKEEHVINLKMRTELFPKLSEVTVLDWEGMEASSDETANEVLSFVYYLLNPVEGIKYVATWLKNKVGGIFIGWHEDIVGSSDSNSSLGMTQYLGFSGYVTTPNLSDIGWIDAIMNNYTNIVVYVLIFMAIIMLMYIIVGQITVQRAIVGFILFGFCALLPPVFLNTTISIINKTCDTIYSSKFDYWAIVQTEEYLGRLQSYEDAKNGKGTDEDILASILSVNNNIGGIENETGYSGMRVKWISPKKFNDMAELTESMKTAWGDQNSVLQTMVINSVASTISGETYLDSDNALYLYRDILDIYRYGSISYNIYAPKGLGGISHISFNTLKDVNKYRYNDSANSIFYDYWLYKNAGTGTLSSSNNLNTFNSVWKPTNNQVPHLSTIYDSNNLFVKYDTDSSDKKIYVTYNDTDYTGLYFRLASNLADDVSTKDIKFLNDTSSLSALRNGFINNKFNNILVNDVKNYYTTDNLATTLLATYSGTYRTIGMHRLGYFAATQKHTTQSYTDYIALNDSAMSGGTTDTEKFTKFANNYVFAEFPKGFNFSLQALQGVINGTYSVDFNQLSHFYYGLYSESPYYFMNYEFRDILKADGYIYDPSQLIDRGSSGDSINNVVDIFLKDKQAYFYNYTDGDGYGELKDFMNMHDFFYYVLPAMKTGVELVNDFDNDFGFYTYDTCPLRIQTDGSFKYNGVTIIKADGSWASTTSPDKFWSELTQQQRYEFWHDLNVNLLCYNYCSWLDTMYDCSYAEPESISVLGEKFLVTDPLDPMTYFQLDDSNNVIAGRYMVFSRSEMKYYGLSMSDLTQVEKKIIDMQDAVYKETISLTNYYNLSNETLIHNYSLLQLFEFNKAFSEDSFLGESYTLYPQGYELKATSYDGYLRLILSGSTGEDLMTDPSGGGNTSIYERIMKKTSIFFGLMLIANDFIAVYAIPALKLFFLIIIFFISILIIIASALKVELNIINVLWKSLISPCIFYAGVSIGLAWIVSLFMSNGSVGVTQDSILIQLGDPTMTILVMLIINIVALILYWKICKKCFADFKKYITAIYHDMFGAVAGTFGKIVSGITSGRYDKGSSGGFSTPKQRGEGNNPKSGKSGVAGALVAGGVAGAVAGDAASDSSEDAKKTKYNALADKANDKINKLGEKEAKVNNKAEARAKEANKEADNLYNKEKEQVAKLGQKHAENKNAFKNLDKQHKEKSQEVNKANEAIELGKADMFRLSPEKFDKAHSNRIKNRDTALDEARNLKAQKKIAKVNMKDSEAKLNNARESLKKNDASRREKIASELKQAKSQNKYSKRISKIKARQDGLNAKGINRYKVAATAGMGAKALAKVSGKALKNSAKFAGKTAVNTAKAAGHMAVDATKAVGNAAVTTTKATINALADNIVDSSK